MKSNKEKLISARKSSRAGCLILILSALINLIMLVIGDYQSEFTYKVKAVADLLFALGIGFMLAGFFNFQSVMTEVLEKEE